MATPCLSNRGFALAMLTDQSCHQIARKTLRWPVKEGGKKD